MGFPNPSKTRSGMTTGFSRPGRLTSLQSPAAALVAHTATVREIAYRNEDICFSTGWIPAKSTAATRERLDWFARCLFRAGEVRFRGVYFGPGDSCERRLPARRILGWACICARLSGAQKHGHSPELHGSTAAPLLHVLSLCTAQSGGLSSMNPSVLPCRGSLWASGPW